MSALVEEATKRAGVIWVRATDGNPEPLALWHVWADGRACVVCGGLEQAAPAGLVDGRKAEVTVASKDKGSRLATWVADAAVIAPVDEQWTPITALLQSKRQNSPDGDAAGSRWAHESTVFVLTPTGEYLGS
jgi:hypothetical protein